jgi:hypothetical protein
MKSFGAARSHGCFGIGMSLKTVFPDGLRYELRLFPRLERSSGHVQPAKTSRTRIVPPRLALARGPRETGVIRIWKLPLRRQRRGLLIVARAYSFWQRFDCGEGSELSFPPLPRESHSGSPLLGSSKKLAKPKWRLRERCSRCPLADLGPILGASRQAPTCSSLEVLSRSHSGLSPLGMITS